MRAAAGFAAFLFVTFGVSAQTVTRSFGSVVFPGGTSATTPGVTRNFGSVVFPGGAAVPTVRTAPQFVGASRPTVRVAPATGQNFRRNPSNYRPSRTNTLVYAYPVFVGGYDTSMVGGEPVAPQPAPMMMYPAEAARPVMIQVAPAPEYPAREPMTAYQPRAQEPETVSEHYMLAFKDK